MKIALITDIHIGARNDNESIAELQRMFFFEFLIPKLKELSIDTIFCGGDFFDKRTHVSLKSMQFAREIESAFEKNDLVMWSIVGNHDTLFRNTNSVNSLSSFYANSKCIHVLKEAEEIKSLNLLLVPWINSENEKTSIEMIQNSKMKYCLGHFAITGFEFHRGTKCDNGINQSLFNHFDLVMSGHFHTASENGNIKYLGSPYEMCWSDYNDPRGFYVFDSDSGILEKHDFTESLFFNVVYNDGNTTITPYKPVSYRNKHVKILVRSKSDVVKFDNFAMSIQQENPADFSIIELKYDINAKIEDTETEVKKHIRGNLDVIQSFVSNMDIPTDIRDQVMEEMTTLYNEALK